jgi:hypothetical protein
MNSLPGVPGISFTLVLIAVVVLRFLARELRVRRMALSRLFVLPAIFALLVIFLVVVTIQQDPGQSFALCIGSLAALVVGAGIGVAVAHFTTVSAGAVPGVVLVRGSATTVAIWIVALLLRLVPRLILGAAPHTPGTFLMLNSVLLVMLAVAIFTVRLQILRRAKDGLLKAIA